MTKYPAVLSMCLALAACASSSRYSVADQQAAPVPASVKPAAPDVEVAQVLEIKDYDQRLVCRREAPLGSRIAHRRCFSPHENEPSAAEQYFERQEFERLREQQANLELMRQEALRRSMQQRR